MQSGTSFYRVDVLAKSQGVDSHLVDQARLLGLGHLTDLESSAYYLLAGKLTQAQAQTVANRLLADPICERASLQVEYTPGRRSIEVQKKAGVMDPVEASIIKAARDLGIALSAVRVGQRVTTAKARDAELELLAWKCLANQAIEEVAIDPSEPIRFPLPGGDTRHARREVPLLDADDQALMRMSKEGCLSLTLEEMRCVQDYFKAKKRNPTDVELESVAQTWSEHCVHKTLKGVIDYDGPEGRRTIDNLLKSTIAKATFELNKPWCISVFKDNSGIIEFDKDFGFCLKVETHNHPSAIEPYGGANTGLGGVIRDILGTGLGAKPVFNTDVFCFGNLDMKSEDLPPGTIHPLRLARRVIAGVRDYGNRMGIPTVNGAVRFDDRYVGNPLVFCGTAGLIPRALCFGRAKVGDHVLVIGGRTGRDGIHGATFSSVELTSESEVVSSGAVQIGNAIEEKKVADTMLRARDCGCFNAITDCGAGGISSAIGEMGCELGVKVHLDRVKLKYEGLGYAEIWISEAQERMVAAVSEDRLEEALAIFAAEDVEATDVGVITGDHRLTLYWHGEVVGDMDMEFLHDGVPRLARKAHFRPRPETALSVSPQKNLGETLKKVLARPNIASKEWIIRQYDHEVQAGSIVKPLVGIGRDAPSDAAVVAPRLGSDRGVAIACGLNTCYGDIDPYHSAAASIEESLRNLICVGGDPERIAILDNFSWGRCDKPANLGDLVRACEACYDLSVHYGAPFISGKDSLNNEYVHQGKTIIIPPTLLITAACVIDDVKKSVTMDLKRAGDTVILLGITKTELGGSEYLAAVGGTGGTVPRLDKDLSKKVLLAASRVIRSGLATAAHDCSEGGLAPALAEMAFGGGLGITVNADAVPGAETCADLATVLFSESQSRILISIPTVHLNAVKNLLADAPHAVIGTVTTSKQLEISGKGQKLSENIDDLKKSWKGGISILGE